MVNNCKENNIINFVFSLYIYVERMQGNTKDITDKNLACETDEVTDNLMTIDNIS